MLCKNYIRVRYEIEVVLLCGDLYRGDSCDLIEYSMYLCESVLMPRLN